MCLKCEVRIPGGRSPLARRDRASVRFEYPGAAAATGCEVRIPEGRRRYDGATHGCELRRQGRTDSPRAACSLRAASLYTPWDRRELNTPAGFANLFNGMDRKTPLGGQETIAGERNKTWQK